MSKWMFYFDIMSSCCVPLKQSCHRPDEKWPVHENGSAIWTLCPVRHGREHGTSHQFGHYVQYDMDECTAHHATHNGKNAEEPHESSRKSHIISQRLVPWKSS